MKSIRKRMTVLMLAAVLIGKSGGVILHSAALEPGGSDQCRQVSTDTHRAVFTVLGISFLCAGGAAAVIAFQKRT